MDFAGIFFLWLFGIEDSVTEDVRVGNPTLRSLSSSGETNAETDFFLANKSVVSFAVPFCVDGKSLFQRMH